MTIINGNVNDSGKQLRWYPKCIKKMKKNGHGRTFPGGSISTHVNSIIKTIPHQTSWTNKMPSSLWYSYLKSKDFRAITFKSKLKYSEKFGTYNIFNKHWKTTEQTKC